MRAALYVRVSSEEQVDGYSLSAQTRACRVYAEQRGWAVIAEYADEGKSAKGRDLRARPQFRAMLEAGERRDFDVVIVHKLDRFARNQHVLWDSLERLGKAGAALASVSEEIDYSTPSGRLFLTMVGGIAEWYSGNLATETRKGKAERRRQGLYNGVLPFGYARKPDRAEAIIDPETAPGVRLAFDLAAAGKTARQIAEALNAAGHRTTGNRGRNPWTRDSVRVLIANRFYLGELPGETPGQHAPLVTPEQFEAAERAVSARALNPAPSCVPRGSRTYSLSGLLVCGRCGARLNIWSDPGGHVQRAYCSRRRQRADCDQPSIRLDVIEDQIADWLSGMLAAEAEAAAAADHLAREAERPDDTAGERRRITGRLDRLKNLYLLGDVTDDEYRRDRESLRRELLSLPASAETRRVNAERVTEIARRALQSWRVASSAERNAMLVAMVERIVVNENRAEVFPRPDFARTSSGDLRKRRDSDTNVPAGRYLVDTSVFKPDQLAEFAATTRALGISEAARIHHTSRQTIRKALERFGGASPWAG